MAEVETYPKPRTPTANLPISLRNEAKAMLQPTQVEVPTYDDIMSGRVSMIGNLEVPQSTIDAAAGGNEAAQTFIRNQLDIAAIPSAQPSQPIAGVTRTAAGEMKIDLPDDLNEYQKGDMQEYAENRIRFFSFLEGKIADPRVRDLLIDHYSTGEFFKETGAQLLEQGRFIGNIPNYAATLGRFVAPAAIESAPTWLGGESDVSFSEAWAKRQPAVAQAFAEYRQQLKDFGIDNTYDSVISERIKEKFIERYGQEVYDRDYKLELEGLGTVESPVIPLGMGEELLDFGFSELPVEEQGLSFLVQNASVSGALGKLHLAKGKRQWKKHDEAVKQDPSLASKDPLTVIRQIEIAEKSNRFSAAWRSMTARIGARFNNRGAMGNVEANESARSAIKNIDNQIKSKRAKLALKGSDSADAKVLRGELDFLQSRRNRLIFGGASNPYMFNMFIDESVIAIGQTAGYQLFPAVGLDSGTGEMLGALSFAFVGKPAIKAGVSSPFKLVNLVSGGNAGVIGMNMVEMMEDLRFLPKGVFVNRSLKELEAAIGRPLDKDEFTSFTTLDRLLKGMPNEQRELVYQSIENYNALRDRIVNRFGPEINSDGTANAARSEAENLFKLSFGHISGLAPLQAMEFSSLKKLDADGLAQAVEFQLQSENSIEMAQVSINRLRELISESSGIDVEDSKFLAGWVTNFQMAADQQTMQIAERKVEYLARLNEYKNEILKDPNVDIDTDVVNKLSEMEIALVPGAKDSIEQQRDIILRTTTDISKRLNDRAKIISDMRGTDGYARQLGRLQEDIYDAHFSSIYAIARNAYRKADAKIGDKDVDISGAIDAFIKTQDVMDSLSLRGLFKPENDFLSSRSGRMAYNAFNDMAERSLKKNMELDDDDVSELMQYVTTQNLADGSLNKDYLGDSVSYIDVALHFSQKEGSQFAPFAAKPFEVEEVRRHFDKMAQIKRDPADARPFTQAANSFDEALRAMPEVFEEVQLARDTYRDLIFDPTRDGSTGKKITSAASGPEFVTKVEGGYRRPYTLGAEPENWHRDLAEQIGAAIDGEAFASRNVKNLVDDLVRFWGDRDEAGNIVFDLTTEKGRAKFENVSNLVRANIYEYWGAAKEAGMTEAIRQNVLDGDLPKGVYNFGASRNLTDRVTPALQVMVKDGDGPATLKPLVDVGDIISSEQDITDILAVSKSAREQHKVFVDTVNGKVGDTGTLAQAAVDLEKRTVRQFEELSKIKDPLKFYETYVLNNDVSLIQGLKADFVDTLVRDGMSEADALQEFNQGMAYMVTNGLIQRASVAPNAKITFKSLTGQKRTVETMTDAATIVADLDNPNVTAILEEFLDPDHIAFMQDIGEYMMYASGTASTSTMRAAGGLRGISPNEVISRAFNIARGMVSPTYVAAEFAVRLMSMNNSNALSLAASNKEAAKIMMKVLNTPGEVTEKELQLFGTLATSFAARTVIQSGNLAQEFVPQEEIHAAIINAETYRETYEKAVP